jgi:hypothetical protein
MANLNRQGNDKPLFIGKANTYNREAVVTSTEVLNARRSIHLADSADILYLVE